MAPSALDLLEQDHRDLDDLFRGVSDPKADRGAVLIELTRREARHIAVERSIVLPVVRKRHLGDDHLADRLEEDYKEMERLLVLIDRRKKTSPDLPDLLNELLDVSRRHHERTAGELRPSMEREMSASDLQDLGAEMQAADDVIVSHPHPHLLSLGPISRLTTRLAGRFDRRRDRTVINR